MYVRYGKRILDFALALLILMLAWPVLLLLTIVGAVTLKGNPFFTQIRPGKDEKLFKLIKFRSMSHQKDAGGKLLPDEDRMTKCGRFLRQTSLDELPELFNILKGDMSFVGPRPQLVRDMVFMTEQQRRRHSVPQGLTGLAQVSGRNNISWERKFEYDLQYIENMSFVSDFKIFLRTFGKVLTREGVDAEEKATSEDLGDYLLRIGRVTKEEYDEKQAEARALLDAVR